MNPDNMTTDSGRASSQQISHKHDFTSSGHTSWKDQVGKSSFELAQAMLRPLGVDVGSQWTTSKNTA